VKRKMMASRRDHIGGIYAATSSGRGEKQRGEGEDIGQMAFFTKKAKKCGLGKKNSQGEERGWKRGEEGNYIHGRG